MKPVLWHIGISHYSEKARWALAYKQVEHERRAPLPGAHMAFALWLTHGKQKTFPVLRLDDRTVGDSTAIIAALEQRFPEPPLYPADADERRRALELEDWFDEELGPPVRLLAWHEAVAPEARDDVAEMAAQTLPPALRDVGLARAAAARLGPAFASIRFGVKDTEAAELARGKIHAALDRLEAELGGGEYLVGESFTVADLTAAALFYPLVLPPQGPALPDPPAGFERFRAPLRERRGYRWVEEMFRRHRKPATVVG